MTSPQIRLDLERENRIGMVEAIWGEHKTHEQIAEIFSKLEALKKPAFVTRVDSVKASKVASIFRGSVEFHQQARCLTMGTPLDLNSSWGDVFVLSGGTSDLQVASEADLALRWHGISSQLFLDVGVAGLQRLLDQLPKISRATALIACAGMEGALPTVLTGLVPQPVIGVPISVGYGVSAGGRSALNGMLSSCAPGLVIVNIDNGYGAAMAALRIVKSLANSSKT